MWTYLFRLDYMHFVNKVVRCRPIVISLQPNFEVEFHRPQRACLFPSGKRRDVSIRCLWLDLNELNFNGITMQRAPWETGRDKMMCFNGEIITLLTRLWRKCSSGTRTLVGSLETTTACVWAKKNSLYDLVVEQNFRVKPMCHSKVRRISSFCLTFGARAVPPH